jgi:hypothetical protein
LLHAHAAPRGLSSEPPSQILGYVQRHGHTPQFGPGP